MHKELRAVNHPCKLEHIGADYYRVLHCEHIVGSEGTKMRMRCCNCPYTRPLTWGERIFFRADGPHGPFLDMSKPDDKAPMALSDENTHAIMVTAARAAIRAITTDPNVTLEHSIVSLKSLKLFIDTQLDQLEGGI